MAWINNNWFYYGEVGTRLNGIRESEVFKGSARSLTNVRINDFGGLKVAKEYEQASGFQGDDNHQEIIDTPFDWYIVLTSTSFILTLKSDHSIIGVLSHNLGIVSSYTIIDQEYLIFTVIDSTAVVYLLDEEQRTMTIQSDYFDDLIFPLESKEDVLIDLYQKQTVGTETVITKLQALTNPKLEVDSSGVISLPGTDLVITRIYIDYKSTVSYEGVEAADGEVFGVLHGIKEISDDGYYILGNDRTNFGTYTNDATWDGDYFTTMDTGEGELTYGVIKNIKEFKLATVFQNRFIVELDGTIYFSKQFEYLDFRTPDVPTYTNEPFYMQPSPINGVQGKIIKLLATDSLYIITDRGVYISGYGFIVSGTNLGNPSLASDIPATTTTVLIESDLYYLTPSGKLKCIQRDYSNTLLEYNVNSVEKFDVKDTFVSIAKHSVEDTEYCIACKGDSNLLYFYDKISVNEFRRTSYELLIDGVEYIPTKLISIEDTLSTGGKLLRRGNNNKAQMKVTLNTPSLSTQIGGSYLNDAHSLLTKVAVKVLNEDDEGVKQVYIDDKLINNLGDNVEDIFSVYVSRKGYSKKIGSGFNILIDTNENDKVIEIQGINYNIEAKGV